MAKNLLQTDPVLAQLIAQEAERQRTTLNLIASENYVSAAVQEAMASVLTNKYAEGYPGRRYYGGCAIVDQVEEVARERAKRLFKAEHANVQPHSGSQANLAVYAALLKAGDTLLAMSLGEGGHLTHGHSVNFSGQTYKAVHYGVDPVTHLLDYDAIEKLALEHKPKLIIAGASAYARTIDFAQFAAIAKKVGAYLMADIAHIAGLIAAELHPSPIGYTDVVTSTTHKTLRGPRGGLILCTKGLAPLIDKAIMPGCQGGPLMHTIAAKAVAFHEALQPEFKLYQEQIVKNARAMAEAFIKLGYTIITGGTDTHLFTVDLRSKHCTGKEAEITLESIGIIVNRNCIPYDPATPFITSGIRIGTPAITTRGFDETACRTIASLIDRALQGRHDQNTLATLKQEVAELIAIYTTIVPEAAYPIGAHLISGL
jgi:glycine hydroxymethyltransferase